MPQALSKFEQSVSRPLSMPTGELQKESRIPKRWNTFRCQKKSVKPEFLPIASKTLHQQPQVEEDWEKEIAEFSRTIEKQKEMAYDPEYELNVAMDEMTMYAVPRAPSPAQDHYIPSKHHVPPVKWTHYIAARVADQFADAEE